MRYFEAPANYERLYGERSVFLAGGITGCPDWQEWMRQRLSVTDLALLNPRRKDFPIHDPSAAKAQIEWEHRHLRKADAILFWFPSETLNPIVLYELGAWSMSSKPLFIGAHPDYQRKQDVIIQTHLVRPDVPIVFSLHDLGALILKW